MTKKRLQINIRSNDYTEALIEAVVGDVEGMDKSKFIHIAIERAAIDMLGGDRVLKIFGETLHKRMYSEYLK